MNKFIKFFLIAMLAIPFSAQSQKETKKAIDTAAYLRTKNTYVDAVKLAKIYSMLQDTNKQPNETERRHALDSIAAILSSYYVNLNWRQGDSSNYLLKKAMPDLELYFRITAQYSDGEPDSIVRPIPSYVAAKEQYNGNPEAMAINAVATFMANRAKEEVLYCAVNKIMDIAEDSNSNIGKKFKILFPQTAKVVAKLKKSGVYYPSDFSLIKQMMEADLRDLPNTLPVVVDFSDSSVNDVEKLVGQVYVVMRDRKKVQPMIDSLGTYHWKDANFRTTARYFELFSNALKDTAGGNHMWMNGSALKSMSIYDDQNRLGRFFYGLLYQQLKYQKEPFIKNICNKINSLERASSFASIFDEMPKIAMDLTKLNDSLKLGKATGVNRILNLTNQVIDNINNISKVSIFEGHITIPNAYNSYIDQAIETIRFIQQKNYTAALSTIVTAMAQDNSISTTDLRKITFFIQLSQLKDESQFANFIESYAAPIGSSSLKRTAKFNVSLNGYVGLNGGYEWVLNSATGNKNNGLYGGLAAPIGFSFSGFPSKCGSWTVFFSVIDLGSLVNMRLKNDSTNYSNLSISQFFSPGIGLYYNIKGTPLTLGGYLCRINDVRNIQYTKGTAVVTETGLNVSRFNFSALIDIPFFTLSNKNKDMVIDKPSKKPGKGKSQKHSKEEDNE